MTAVVTVVVILAQVICHFLSDYLKKEVIHILSPSKYCTYFLLFTYFGATLWFRVKKKTLAKLDCLTANTPFPFIFADYLS